MQQLTVNCRDVNQWLQDRNKLNKHWGIKLKAIQLQTKKVIDYIKTLKIESVQKILAESKFEK